MSAPGMNGTKWKLLFFAPVFRIIRTDYRTKANIHERKRIAIVHAKFAFSENTPYFHAFCIMALVTHLLRVTIELMTAWIFIRVITHIMASFWRAIIAPIMTWLLCRVTRAITQVILAYRYCAFGDADFMSRYCKFNDTNFSCRYCRYNGAWFCVRNCRCNVVDFGVPLQRQSWRAVIGALYRVWWRAFWRPTYAL